MGADTAIGWCDATVNWWTGCQRISAGCDACYAEARAHRFGRDDLWLGARQRTAPATWAQPLAWNRAAERAGIRRRVFTLSLGDFFDNHRAVAPWRAEAWEVIDRCRSLDWLLLTKRPQNILRMLPATWGASGWPHVWIGTTTENQAELDRRWPHLAAVPAVVRFLSCEPLLEHIDLGEASPDWIITGSESGPGARPCDLAWVRSLRDQCTTRNIAFFWKQHVVKGKKIELPPLDGRVWAEFPR